jgi:ferredoxin
MRKCGMEDALPGWLERVEFSESRRCPTASHPSLELAAAALDAGALVNLPKLKTHAYTGLTLAVKNLFGCVTGTKKAQWHLRAGENPELFAKLLVEIAYSFPPGLIVVDGVVGMEGNGPGSGDPRALGLLVAGDDPTAVDAVIARIAGFPEEAVPTLAAARRAGLGQPDLERIEVLGERLADVAVKDFRPAAADTGIGVGIPRVLRGVLRGALTGRPVIDANLCRLCGRCAEACPPKAIAMDAARKAYPRIDRARCIRCFCCQEMCPHRAITVRQGWLRRWGILR